MKLIFNTGYEEKLKDICLKIVNDINVATNYEFNNVTSSFILFINVIKDIKSPIVIQISDIEYKINLFYTDKITQDQMLYQLSHELTHIFFYGLYGSDYKHNNFEEEKICSAMSLCIVKKHCSSTYYEAIITDLLTHKNFYKEGINVAESCCFEIEKVYGLIKKFNKNCINIIEY